MIENIFLLLVLFQLKHFLADYPGQTEYMLRKNRYVGWFLPLIDHAFTHAVGTALIILFWGGFYFGGMFFIPWLLLFLPLFDLVTHFIMARVKASPWMWGKYKPQDKYFWWALGFDQMVHHLSDYVIIYVMISSL
jgi:hypothetical protein